MLQVATQAGENTTYCGVQLPERYCHWRISERIITTAARWSEHIRDGRWERRAVISFKFLRPLGSSSLATWAGVARMAAIKALIGINTLLRHAKRIDCGIT
jgi:hypothetical protein